MFFKALTILVFLFYTNTTLLAQKISFTEVAILPEKITNNAVCEGFINDTAYIYIFGGLDSTKLFSGNNLQQFGTNPVH